jgi:hypothetical protein
MTNEAQEAVPAPYGLVITGILLLVDAGTRILYPLKCSLGGA